MKAFPMSAWQKGWFRRFLMRNAWSGVLCAAVLVLTVVTGLLAARLFFNFWFDVFLYAFPPTWLYCLGLLFSARWKWREMAFGVGTAILMLAFLYNGSSDRIPMRLLWSGVLSGSGLGAMAAGFVTAGLWRILLAKVRQTRSNRAALSRKPKTNLSR